MVPGRGVPERLENFLNPQLLGRCPLLRSDFKDIASLRPQLLSYHTLVLKMRHLTFSTEWTCCTTASPKWYRCLGWPSGVCAVFWGKMPSSSAEKSRLYRFPEIQTWCLILVQISLARADLQNDRPKQTVTGALMLPKRAAHAVHTTSDSAVHTRRDSCSAAGCVRAAHEK